MVGSISIFQALIEAADARLAEVSDSEVAPNAFIRGLYMACQSGASQMPHWVCTPSCTFFSLAASAIICDQVQLSVGTGTPADWNSFSL